MNRFWKWLSQRSFMRDYMVTAEQEQTAEEALGVAVLRIVDEYSLGVGMAFKGAVVGHKHEDGSKLAATHFEIFVCDTPEICFGPTFAERISIQ